MAFVPYRPDGTQFTETVTRKRLDAIEAYLAQPAHLTATPQVEHTDRIAARMGAKWVNSAPNAAAPMVGTGHSYTVKIGPNDGALPPEQPAARDDVRELLKAVLFAWYDLDGSVFDPTMDKTFPAALAALRTGLSDYVAGLVVPEWQPIETAPRDGEPVLLYKPNERMVGEYILAGYWGEWPGKPDGWIACSGTPLGYKSKVTDTNQGWPTHWMPLPKAPEQPA